MQDIVMALWFLVIMIITLSVIFAIFFLPTILSYRYYKKSKLLNKKIKKAQIILTSILTVTVLLIVSFFFIPSGFGPEYETYEINQEIGGKLLCNSEYHADLHSWDYLIDYVYIINGDTIDIGRGWYHGVENPKNEQLEKNGNWISLTTGNGRNSTKLITKSLVTDSTEAK